MKKRIEFFSLILGSLFLISGIAKSLDISVFSGVLTNYGFERIQFISPLIVLTETITGLLLIFQINLKRVSLVAISLLSALTIAYTYGIIFRGIDDCGCFGKITILNTSPVFTFMRNAVLLYMSIEIWRKSDNKTCSNKWIVSIILMVMSMVAFMSGYTYPSNTENSVKKHTEKALEESVLKDFITTSQDSTYFVFVFSYTCSHCYSSIENLKQYERLGVADRVIALSFETDSVIMTKFNEIFEPNFQIINYSPSQLFSLTDHFPVSYYIQHNVIKNEIRGMLPCGYLLTDK